MAASTLALVIKTDRSVADITGKIVKDATARKEAIRALMAYLNGVAGGAEHASIDVHTASVAPVAASLTITITHANLADGDALVLAGVTLTAKSSGANGTSQYNIGAYATADATALKNCINSNTTLSKFFLATSALGVVTVTCRVKTELANCIGASSSDNAFAFSGSGYFTSGAGGAQGAATNYGFGL